MAEQGEVKKRRGRPSLHGPDSTVLSVRASKADAVRIAGLVSAIKLADRNLGAPDAAVILEALEGRVRHLANRAPQVLMLVGAA